MTPRAQRITIAEACGWERREPDNLYPEVRWLDPQNKTQWRGDYAVKSTGLPDYLNDLNAMHEAEKVLGATQQDIYACILEEMITPDFLGDTSELDPDIIMFRDIHATATQRAEAFVRTLNLWKD